MKRILRPAHQWCLPWARKCLCTIILASAILGVLAAPAEAQELQDVVYLKDGSVIRGTIVEQVPGESILIETVDGSRFRYSMDDIDRIAKEPPPSRPAPQVPARATKSPGTAWALSFLIPGAGQFYNGDTSDGVWMLIAHGIFSAWLAEEVQCVGSECDDNEAGLAALFLIGNWVLAQVDAYQGAKRINSGLRLNMNLGAEIEIAPAVEARLFVTPYGTRTAVDVRLVRWTW